MHTKNADVRVKAGPDDGLGEGEFTAYASIFGNVDSYGDVVAKGAFADSLKSWADSENELPLLFGHNMSDPDYNIGHVTEAKEDDRGLFVTAQLDLESPKAMQVYRLLKGRRLSQMSFAYDVLDEGQVQVEGRKVNELRKLKIHEVSTVPLGANQETEVLTVKAAADLLLDGLKAGRVISAKNESELRKAHDAIGAVLSTLSSTEDDQEKASGTGPVKDDEPDQVKSDEPSLSPSVESWAAQLRYLTHA